MLRCLQIMLHIPRDITQMFMFSVSCLPCRVYQDHRVTSDQRAHRERRSVPYNHKPLSSKFSSSCLPCTPGKVSLNA